MDRVGDDEDLAETIAREAASYLATVDLFRLECGARTELDDDGDQVLMPAGPCWHSEADELAAAAWPD